MSYRDKLAQDRIPSHVAIIMDGNGRWAKERGMDRSLGHKAGVETVRTITETAARLGVDFLTLYTFSIENWNRPVQEVSALMNLLLDSIEEEIFMKNNVSFQVIGERAKLPESIQNRLEECIRRTSGNTGMCLVLALSYSSRWEITHAVNRILSGQASGAIAKGKISEEEVGRYLSTSFMPDPDLLIRTGGERRLSNFLLWQSAYTELYFCDTYWPDFNNEELYKAIYDFQQRERRFGKTSEQI